MALISLKLPKSSYLREKSFKYPISSQSSFQKQSSLQLSSQPKASQYKPCPTDPNLYLPVPLTSSVLTFSRSQSRKHSVNQELLSSKPSSPKLSQNSNSFLPSPSKSISKISENPESIEIQASVRSGFQREICEISAILEENSENPITHASILHTSKDREITIEIVEGEVPNDCSLNKSVKEKLKWGFEEKRLGFEEAISVFKGMNVAFLHQKLWIQQWRDFCCCFREEKLDTENLELCEKLIVFTYIGFNVTNSFHNQLLSSVFEELSAYCIESESWTGIGFSNDSPYEDLKHNAATLGLLQILFAGNFMPKFLEECLRYCLGSGMAFILISFDMSEISIMVLRKKQLNKRINQYGKAIEVIFFLYAGCLSYWFSLSRGQSVLPGEINYFVEKLALEKPDFLISLAKEKWELNM